MTHHNRPPKLYITSDLLEKARDEHIAGVTAHSSAHEIMQRGSEGRLRGLSVSRLVLHASADTADEQLKVHRVVPYQYADSLEVSERPGMHPRDFAKEGLPEVHSLVVPIKEFDTAAAAWALHGAAARYAQELGLPRAGERELRPPTEGFGVSGLDAALSTGLQLLGGIISRAQPPEKRESPEQLAEQLQKGVGSIIGRGVDAIQAVQDLPGGDNTPHQAPLAPVTPAEMAGILAGNPPIFFYFNR